MSNMKFKAEVKELLNIVINSIYSNREIFLRELIANAADAIDKRRFLSLTHAEYASDGLIRISANPDAKTLTISDNGIGMDESDLINNLGTIAHSGSKEFLKTLEKSSDKETNAPELIGQFGVGFYSAFMAAGKVTVLSRKVGEEKANLWSSSGIDSFEIQESTRDEYGTTVTLYLKDDFSQFLEYWEVSSLVRKYSDYIAYPIKMQHTVTTGEGDKKQEEIRDETLNSMKAIWLKPESEVSEEEYKAFYQHLTGEGDEPLKRINFTAEGASEFKALIFLAKHLPWSYQFGVTTKKNLNLYVKRVFITDECPDLLPGYMCGFVSGVVDSSDLPLNVSRETLQNNPQVRQISKAITNRVLKELASMMNKDRGMYETFYAEFARLIKQGTCEDWENKEKLQNLLLFQSMKNQDGKQISLKEYVDAMPANQKVIYYAAGESRSAIESMPQLELIKKQGFDVLFLLSPLDDEIVFSRIRNYAEKDLVSVTDSDLKLDEPVKEEMEKKAKEAADKHKDMLAYLKDELKDRVSDVRFSTRLTDSACCLVNENGIPSVNLQKVMKRMNQIQQEYKQILELNPESSLILAMTDAYTRDSKDPILADYAKLLFNQALISDGNELPDPAEFVRLNTKIMTQYLQQNSGNK